jgi:surfactin synthase thioesterase subunit/glycosyltransferase involved in cell wall biosynthesis
MRILLAHNSLYYPSLGGGDKSNRLLMEALTARGHAVRVVARVEKFGPEAHQNLLKELAARDITVDSADPSAVKFSHHGVEVHVLTQNPQLRAYFEAQIAEFDPDVIVTSTDDPGQLLFEVALRAPRARVVHLVRATIAVPFGPDSSMVSIARTEALRRADGVVGVSEYVARYVREFGRMDAVHTPISLMEPAEFPKLGRFENPFVTMVNPCAVKGVSILLGLGERMPQVQFAAVPVWGTTADDIAALRRRANITILPPVENIDELLRQTRIMLVPSVWAEARSRMIPEAMLRGVPVLASNIGGIPEAMLGVDYLLPVNPITHYKPSVDEHMVPVAEVPAQDIRPWHAALESLITDPEHYRKLSLESREAALDYAANLSVNPFEKYLESLVRSPQRDRGVKAAGLSSEKRKLLALRLKQASGRKEPENMWFANLNGTGPRLFCFPFAAGGTGLYRSWVEALKPHIVVCPVRLPGRELRMQEAPFDRMDSLVETLAREIAPYLDRPFAFYGHSMGAAIAFELVRALRRAGQRLPFGLFVSAARAPQFRLGHQPQLDPDDATLIEELQRLQSVPAEVLEHPELMSLMMPTLRADTRLYRNYVYRPEEPLSIPIYAFGGIMDPNVGPEHIAAWREQTTGPFAQENFAGGHFFIRSSQDEVLTALRRRLSRLLAEQPKNNLH